MSKQTVLLIGATGETGGSILNGLLERGTFVCHFSPDCDQNLTAKCRKLRL